MGHQSSAPWGHSSENPNYTAQFPGSQLTGALGDSTYNTNESPIQQFHGSQFTRALGYSTYNTNESPIQQCPDVTLPLTSGNGYAGNGSGNQGYLSPVPLGNEPAAREGESLDDRYTAQTPAPLASGASPLTPTPNTIIISSPYYCQLCPDSPEFATLQDLNRHINTIQAHWTNGTRVYRCSCGRGVARKDNYLRHIGTCRSLAKNPYTCMCNEKSLVRHKNVEHVWGCGRRRQP